MEIIFHFLDNNLEEICVHRMEVHSLLGDLDSITRYAINVVRSYENCITWRIEIVPNMED